MSWVKLHRSREFDELLSSRPNAYLVLSVLAVAGGEKVIHTSYRRGGLVGDYIMRLTRAKYRTALSTLKI